MDEGEAFLATLLDFCAELRAEGLKVGTDDAMAYASAAALLDPTVLEDLYWAGRITLAHAREQIPTYDAVFTRFFLGGHESDGPPPAKAPTPTRGADAVFDVPSGDRPEEGEEGSDTTRLGAMAAAVVVDRSKSFAECSEEELAALRRIISQIRVAPPTRRTRRRRGAKTGKRMDLRKMARETMRSHGEPGELAWLERRIKPRPLVLILDISGSMADYSRNLLQFAHSTRRATSRVEVFCFGTGLTRITPMLRRRDPDEALALAGEEARDWAGGTYIGKSLDTFVRKYARRGIARGAVVVICSDGLDRGDPALLDASLERLGRLCHRIVWMNPLKGDIDDYTATSLGMSVAMPHVDLLWSGHSLNSLEAFAGALPDL